MGARWSCRVVLQLHPASQPLPIQTPPLACSHTVPNLFLLSEVRGVMRK